MIITSTPDFYVQTFHMAHGNDVLLGVADDRIICIQSKWMKDERQRCLDPIRWSKIVHVLIQFLNPYLLLLSSIYKFINDIGGCQFENLIEQNNENEWK
jgi:hypothetical protein